MGRYDHLIGTELASGNWSWDSDRAMLYAVGVGAGLDDPLKELQFTTENSPGIAQQVLPSFMTQMGIAGNWAEPFGWGGDPLYPIGVVHGEQSIALARPLPSAAPSACRRCCLASTTRGRPRWSSRKRGSRWPTAASFWVRR